MPRFDYQNAEDSLGMVITSLTLPEGIIALKNRFIRVSEALKQKLQVLVCNIIINFYLFLNIFKLIQFFCEISRLPILLSKEVSVICLVFNLFKEAKRIQLIVSIESQILV